MIKYYIEFAPNILLVYDEVKDKYVCAYQT